MKIGILIVATNKYKQFVAPLIRSIDKYMFIDKVSGKRLYNTDTVLFTDDLFYFADHISPKSGDLNFGTTINTHPFLIPSYKFPQATLFRYRIFSNHSDTLLSKYDYLIYMDADSLVVDYIDDEILAGDITAVHHPGFYVSKGWGSTGDNENSNSFLIPEYRNNYVAGGIQGGKSEIYLDLASRMADSIELDLSNNIIPIHNDETVFNYYVNYMFHKIYPQGFLNILSPAYCMVENMSQREEWGLLVNNISPKILALDKNHSDIRK